VVVSREQATQAAALEGFPFRNLRHTGATLALQEGTNPVLVAFRLGHASTAMIERHYGELGEGFDREIAYRQRAASRAEAAVSHRYCRLPPHGGLAAESRARGSTDPRRLSPPQRFSRPFEAPSRPGRMTAKDASTRGFVSLRFPLIPEVSPPIEAPMWPHFSVLGAVAGST
jgi:hypothetical protein